MALGLEWLSWTMILEGNVLLFASYLIYMSWHYRHFTRQGIPMSSDFVPVFGTTLKVIKEGAIQSKNGLHERLGKSYGGLAGRTPVLSTIDPDVIREVFIKDHASFPHRYNFPTGDQVFDTMLQNIMDYDHWKILRNTMTPTFSSGKLKRMMKQINSCAAVFANHLANETREGKSLEMKEFAGSFTMDVIASTAFGLQVNAKEDRDNEFVRQARTAFDVNVAHPALLLRLFCPFLIPFLLPFKIGFINKECKEFFTNITNQIIDARKESDPKDHVDFIQLMMDAHRDEEDEQEDGNSTNSTRGKKRALTRQEIVSQGVIFFLAGYETTATTISFLAYNLACHPEQQNKLIAEIQAVMGERTEVTDEDLHQMPYLDMCVSESLRMYPPAIIADRVPNRDVVLKGIHMPKGSVVIVSVYHMHHNAEIYPDPEAFIPERFSPEEKRKRDPLTYMPFGAGPRNCIASRLALLEVKVAMVHVLSTHRFVTAPDTQIPITFTKKPALVAENGVWLTLQKQED